MMNAQDIADDIDALVDNLDPLQVEDLMERSELSFKEIMERITNELKARLVIE